MMKLAWDSKEQKARADGKYVRDHSSPLYHTARWNRLSRVWRQSHPLCEMCKQKGIVQEGEVVDHIVPMPICEEYFFDEGNLQTLCQKCNHLKGQRDKKIIEQWRLKKKKL